MKKITISIVLAFITLLFIACPNGSSIFSNGVGSASIVPAELIGKWSASNSGAYASSCIGTWEFTSSTVSYSEVCDDSSYNTSWKRSVAEVWDDDDYLKTENDMYVAWHIEGTSIYVDKTNPYYHVFTCILKHSGFGIDNNVYRVGMDADA